MAGILVLSMRPPRLGIGPRLSHLQPQFAIEATNGFLADYPALAIQQGPDPPIAEPWVRPASSSMRRANSSCSSR